jgi:hypothetical protein
MAYDLDTLEDRKRKLAAYQQAPTAQPAPEAVSYGSAPTVAGPALASGFIEPTQAPRSSPTLTSFAETAIKSGKVDSNPTSTGTGFVNFDRYFNANSGQAAKMASGMARDVDLKGFQAKAGIGGLQTDWSETMNDLQGTGKKMWASQAAMPDYGTVQKNADNAQQAANLLASSDGRQAMLQEKYAKGGYGGGLSRFDTALTGSVGQGRFDALKKQYGSLNDYLAQQTANSAKQSSNYQKKAATVAQQQQQAAADAANAQSWATTLSAPTPAPALTEDEEKALRLLYGDEKVDLMRRPRF